MLRSDAKLLQRFVQREARVAALTPADTGRGSRDEDAGRTAGANDPTSGEWKRYGLLDFTLLGDGFRLGE